MKTQKKSKGFTIFAIAAIVLLAIGFAVGVSDNAKLLTASVVSGMSIADMQTKLNQVSETMAKNEQLLNDIENSNVEKQNLEAQISELKEGNKELTNTAFELIAALNKPIVAESTSTSGSSSHSSKNTCTMKASDCPGIFDANSCSCITIPPARPNPAKNIL